MTSRQGQSCLFFAGLGCALLGAPRAAFAGPGDATRLEYARSERAARCPDADALKAAVIKRLGYDLFFPAARQTISVEITNDDAGSLSARMRLVNDQGIIVGSRELSEPSANCDELVASLALAISIALDPSAALGGERGEATSDPEVAADVSSHEAAPSNAGESKAAAAAASTKPRRAPPSDSSTTLAPTANTLTFALRASGFVAWGIAPATAFGMRGGLEVRTTHFALTAELNDQFPASRKIDLGRAEASLITGGLAPCLTTQWFAGCALFRAGSMRTIGVDIQNPLAQRTLYLASGLRAEATPVLVGALHFVADADVERSLTPMTLRLYGLDQWKTPFVSFSLSAGFALWLG